MSPVLLAFLLALFTGVAIVIFSLAINMWAALFYGVLAGIVVGDINLGLQVGATCTLMSLGFYTYGGATIPDYSIGAVFGVFVASQVAATGASVELALSQALTVATAIALLMTLFDILGRVTTTVFHHGGDRALARQNIKSYERWHLAGTIPWGLSRFIPVFIGMLFINKYEIVAEFINNISWLQAGLGVVGSALPAGNLAITKRVSSLCSLSYFRVSATLRTSTVEPLAAKGRAIFWIGSVATLSLQTMIDWALIYLRQITAT
ncbi:hypothetical protein FACS189468_8610 [Spirochaetia bacterium]|nr:hypothetical protein FACS189468_8610 [Spirochaetia bacterium]